MHDLTGHTALVTGASRGLGFAAARALALRGARLVIASRGGERLADAQRALADEGIAAAAIAADLRHLEEIERLVEEAQMRLGQIDILVANNGGPPPRAAAELTEEEWQAAVPAVLLFVPRLVRLVLPAMRAAGWGRIVAINSISSRQPVANLALSNALRPAVLGYLKTLSQEVAADGVTVNSATTCASVTPAWPGSAAAAAHPIPMPARPANAPAGPPSCTNRFTPAPMPPAAS